MRDCWSRYVSISECFFSAGADPDSVFSAGGGLSDDASTARGVSSTTGSGAGAPAESMDLAKGEERGRLCGEPLGDLPDARMETRGLELSWLLGGWCTSHPPMPFTCISSAMCTWCPLDASFISLASRSEPRSLPPPVLIVWDRSPSSRTNSAEMATFVLLVLSSSPLPRFSACVTTVSGTSPRSARREAISESSPRISARSVSVLAADSSRCWTCALWMRCSCTIS
mmetsp:Transcript_38713/g.95269  ORF Transcript_38713/g.95269 Transcript_38713/m.95269 type:complete len:227 (-) Transcript_38713:1198-1878(-)